MAWCRTLGLWAAMMLFIVSSILPAPWQRENCMQSSPPVRRNWWIQNEVIMLPVFPIMALSGPLFTEMNDGEAWGEGCCADRWGCGVLCRHLWFHARCQQYVNNLSLSNL